MLYKKLTTSLREFLHKFKTYWFLGANIPTYIQQMETRNFMQKKYDLDDSWRIALVSIVDWELSNVG